MKDHSTSLVNRRALLTSTVAAAAAGVAPAAAATHKKPGSVVVTIANPVVETNAGKIRGCIRSGIYNFKGVPYGAPTGGAARFQPPKRPTPWTGVRSCLSYGPMCPAGIPVGTGGDNSGRNDEDIFLLHRNANRMGAAEDCLRLNVWTPEINGSGKRPVMVWMHGGGYTGGSGNDLLSYDGENLARRGDVVVVTHNHRLNAFGYLNLAGIGGERYAHSANVGMLDIVAVLEWVRDNIGRFGGDPGNVTVFGQSGGGGKVSVLMAMPAAKGLFHKAIVQSGPTLRVMEPESSERLGEALLTELGVAKSDVEKLHEVPADRLAVAMQGAIRRSGLNWSPSLHPVDLPQHPFDPSAPSISVNVPLLIGTNLNEGVHGVDKPDADTLTSEEMTRQVRQRFGDKADRIIAAYRKEYPKAKPLDILSVITVADMRQTSFTQADRKAALGGAPAYQYLFAWHTPQLDGRPRAFHSCEIAFVFNNADLCTNLTGGTPESMALADRISGAWVNFARHGNPNHSGLPHWPAFTADRRATMVFDIHCEVRNDPEGEGRRLITGR